MSFEEEYPSLVRCWLDENGPQLGHPDRSFQEWRIKQCCLDKERVREALEGIDKTELEGGWWETSTGAEFGTKILKELGL